MKMKGKYKLTDLIQSTRKLKHPQIRVWVHPDDGGSDYYSTFKTYIEALAFIFTTKGAEGVPLIAHGGYEYNIQKEIEEELQELFKSKKFKFM